MDDPLPDRSAVAPTPPCDAAADAALPARILRASSSGVAVLAAPDWRVVYANPAFRALVGGDGAALGARLADILPDMAEPAAAQLPGLVAAGRRGAVRTRHADAPGGAARWIDLELIPLDPPDAAPPGTPVTEILALLRDVTADAAAQAAHAEANSTLDALMRHIPEGITIADAPDVVTRRISAYGLAMTGRGEAEVVGIGADRAADVWDVRDAAGSPLAPERLPLRRAVTQGEVIIDEVLLLRRPDGRELALLCNAGPIRRDDGSISGGVIAWRDVTEQRQAAAALQDALDLREVLLAELNHRVMNSLQLVTGLLKMQQRRLSDPAAAEALAEAGSRVHVIAGAYRHLSHIDGIGRVALAPLLAEICAQLDHIRPGVAVRCAAIDPALTLNADRAAPLGLVVNELITNACKHGFPDGTGDAAGGQVTVEAAHDAEGRLVVQVADDGIGLGPEADRTQGLGQTLLRSLVMQIDASMDVVSDAGGGTRTTISLHQPG